MKPPEHWWTTLPEVIGQDVLKLGQSARQAATYNAVVEAILQARPQKLLDVGANFGILNMWLTIKAGTSLWGGTYTGVDSNPQAVALANRLGNPVIEGNVRSLPFDDRAFDCVVMKDVIEHLESADLLSEVFRVARKRVLIAVYLPWSDDPTMTTIIDGFYRTVYNKDAMLRLIEGYGFRMASEQSIAEKDGTMNALYFWERP